MLAESLKGLLSRGIKSLGVVLMHSYMNKVFITQYLIINYNISTQFSIISHILKKLQAKTPGSKSFLSGFVSLLFSNGTDMFYSTWFLTGKCICQIMKILLLFLLPSFDLILSIIRSIRIRQLKCDKSETVVSKDAAIELETRLYKRFNDLFKSWICDRKGVLNFKLFFIRFAFYTYFFLLNLF